MQENKPLLSIIVPVYNSSQHLGQCIESIINQTFNNFELILINDGSQDSSGLICDSYKAKDGRIVAYHQSNKGVSSARNQGLSLSKGKWIMFIDSDDWINKDYLSNIFSFLDYHEPDLVIWGIKLLLKHTSIEKNIQLFGYHENKDSIYELLISSDINELLESPCNKLFKHEIIREHNIAFDLNLSYLEDMNFNYFYLKKINSIFGISNVYYNYRKNDNDNTLSQKHPNNYIEIIHQSINLRKDLFSEYNGYLKNKYLCSLQKKMERAYLSLNVSMYNNKINYKTRIKEWKKFIRRNNIEYLNDNSFHFVLKSKNPIVIDSIFKVRYLINKFTPYIYTNIYKIKCIKKNLLKKF